MGGRPRGGWAVQQGVGTCTPPSSPTGTVTLTLVVELMCHHSPMHAVSYHRHRFPAEVIEHAVWLYFRFPLAFGMSRICWPSVASMPICLRLAIELRVRGVWRLGVSQLRRRLVSAAIRGFRSPLCRREPAVLRLSTQSRNVPYSQPLPPGSGEGYPAPKKKEPHVRPFCEGRLTC